MIEKTNPQKILIIGAGLAGICVARRLHENHFDFKIIDQGLNESSRVAAGVINPLVFRRTTKSWRVDEFLPVAVDFYDKLSSSWGNKYYEPIPIRRAFSHLQEKETWLERQNWADYSPYMKPIEQEDSDFAGVKNTFGTGVVLQSAYIHTAEFLSDAKKWLQENNHLIEKTFKFDDLNPSNGTFDGEQFDAIIFCEGYHGIKNPFFNYLPLEATKGEILTVESTEIKSTELLNRKCFILPVGKNQFKVGATYTWRSPNTDLTNEAKDLLLGQANALVDAKIKIVDHQAGVRPTVLDRRPLIGTHPIYTKLKIFNGLGAKGYLMAPLLSQEFVASLKNISILDKEVDIERYKKRFIQE
jgi:glycine oxidase